MQPTYTRPHYTPFRMMWSETGAVIQKLLQLSHIEIVKEVITE